MLYSVFVNSRQTSMAPTQKAACLAVKLGAVLGSGTCRSTDGSQPAAMISSENFRCDERCLRVRPVQLRLETPFWGSSGAGLAASSGHPGVEGSPHFTVPNRASVAANHGLTLMELGNQQLPDYQCTQHFNTPPQLNQCLGCMS